MLYLAIALAILAVVLLFWGVTRARAASTFSLRAAALDERAQSLEADLAGANDRVGSLEKAVQQANERADQQTQRSRELTDEARRSDEMAEDAVQRAVRAETDAAQAKELLQRAEVDRLAALADRDAVIAGAGPLHPDALWQLEVRRVERLWRDRLALQPDETSPFAEGPDGLASSLRVLAEASREESGVAIELVWSLALPLRNDRRVQLARVGEELVAAMRESDGGELEIAGGDNDAVEFRVRTAPPVELPALLVETLALLDVVPVITDGVLIVSVPPRGERADELVDVTDDATDATGEAASDDADGAEPPSGEAVDVSA